MLYDAAEKLAITSTHPWPQHRQNKAVMGDKRGVTTISRSPTPMDKPNSAQELALKCPRCDSSNTKFCYYNNYSLSQPRHFCKACKRYWTRGGTLRNVPVGGGCRKNKRAKRSTPSDPPPLPPPSSRTQPQISISSAAATSNDSIVDHLIYGLPTAPSDMSLGFPRLTSKLLSSSTSSSSSSSLSASLSSSCTPYNLQQQQQQQLNSTWLSYPSEEFQASYNPTTQIPDGVVSSSPLILQDFALFGSSSSCSLASSTLEHQKLVLGMKEGLAPASIANFPAYFPLHELQMAAKATANATILREPKMERDGNLATCNKSEVQEWQVPTENPYGALSTANSSFYWNPSDSTIFGSSYLASLI